MGKIKLNWYDWWKDWANFQEKQQVAEQAVDDHDFLLYGGAAGPGKLLRVDEPIATPRGWTTMGELKVGDTVFDCHGFRTKVTWCSPIERNPDAWELQFDDSQSIECDSGHQWVTLTGLERERIRRSDPKWREERRKKRPSRAKGNKSEAFGKAISLKNSLRRTLRSPVPPKRGSSRTTQEIVDTIRVRGRTNHSIVNPEPLDL